jgi:hypothetical protein
MDTLLTKEILNDRLFEDLTKFTSQDYRVNPDIFITNYLYFASFFSTERIKLAVGSDRPTNSNLFVTIVGNSGIGKSYINQFFYQPIMDIQIELFNQDKETNEFVMACKGYSDSTDDISIQQKEDFVTGYNRNHNLQFSQFLTKKIAPHIFMVNDFTPEALTVKFNSSRNNTILLNADEFEELQNNISRTKTVENTFSFLTSFFEGKSDVITRKTAEDIIISNAKLAVLANTVPATFEKLKQSDFFSSGLGYRYLFYINTLSNIEDPVLSRKTDNSISFYEEYQGKISSIFRSFFYNMVYMSVNKTSIIRINEDHTLKIYNDCLLKLWNDHVKANENLKDCQKETFKSRLSTMFNKCILNTFIMNYSYGGNSLVFPIAQTDLTEDDIVRGYKVYDYYLSQMVCIFDSTPKSDLTPTEQRIIEPLEIGTPTLVSVGLEEALKNGIAKATFYRLMQKKSNQFSVAINKSSNKPQITRLY